MREDHVFHHENVMGTSLELRVLAENEAGLAKWAEARVLGEIDRLCQGLQRLRRRPASSADGWRPRASPPGSRADLFDLLQASATTGEPGAVVRSIPGSKSLSRLWSRSAKLDQDPDRGRTARRSYFDERNPRGSSTRSRAPPTRTSTCPISTQRDRQGLYRRQGRRCRDGSRPGDPRPAPERRRRPPGPGRGPPDDRDRRANGATPRPPHP